MSLLKESIYLRLFGLFKVPLIYFLKPTVEELNDKTVVIKIPLTWRAKNHLRSMYFGSLCVGADCAGGILAMKLIDQSKKPVSLVFKDFKAQFLKRPESDVHFICHDGDKIKKLVEKTIQSGERENTTVSVIATCPKKLGEEPVAKFELTLSLKRK